METENNIKQQSDDKNTVMVFDPSKGEFVEMTKEAYDSMKNDLVINHRPIIGWI